MSGPRAIAGLLALLLAAGAAEAQLFKAFAFGDSITLADPLYDNSNPYLGGYPGRLEDMLGCTPTTCVVVNKGKGGERTAGGVTRIDTILDAERWDVVYLMEGTNDFFRNPPISPFTVNFNLDTMGNKAKNKGVEAVHADIIWFHPDGVRGTTRNDEVELLHDLLIDRAALRGRSFVSPWSVLCPDGSDPHGHNQTQCFNLHYFGGVPDPDPVGHPNATGFDMMADVFFDVAGAVPAPGQATPTAPTGTINETRPLLVWERESPVRATWYRVQLVGPLGLVMDSWFQAFDVCTGTSCSWRVLPILEDGEYLWWVRSRNLRGYGPWSVAGSFTVIDDLIFADGFETGDTSSWSMAVP